MKIMAVLIYVSAGHYYYYFTFIVLLNMARCFFVLGIILFVVAVVMIIYCLSESPSSVSVVGYGATTLSGCYNPIWVNTIKVSTSTQTSQEFLNLFKISKASLKYKKIINLPFIEGNATFGNATQHRYFFNGYPLYSLEGGYFNYCVSAWTTQPVPSLCLAQLHLFNDINYCHQFVRDNAISKAIQKSSCLDIEEHCIYFSFPSKNFYCVGLEIDPGVDVTMAHIQTHASGQLIQIDITGLQPENCALGGSVDTCDILISDNKPTASNEEICIVTENISNDIAQPAWTITTSFKYKIWSAASVSTLTIGLLAFLCFFCFCCTWCKCIK